MGDSHLYHDLVERISDAFAEIDSDAITDFADSNEEYASLIQELSKMKNDYPFIAEVLKGSGAINLSEENHGILAEYFRLYMRADNMEREQLYFRGHADCIAYLKRIGVL